MKLCRKLACSLAIVTAARPAAAQQLDTLFPPSIPGYDNPFGVGLSRHAAPARPATGMDLAGVTLAPALSAQTGYDSAPNGAAGSPFGVLAPSLSLADPQIGFAAFAGLTAQDEFTDRRQNTVGRTVAAGLRAAGNDQTITIAALSLSAQETGFALTTTPASTPIAFTLRDIRLGDDIVTGPFTLSPSLSLTGYGFPGLTLDDRTDTRAALTLTYDPGGLGRLVASLHATKAAARDRPLSATTEEALAGLEDTADALWTWRLLGGAARRRGRLGGTLTLPVLEAGLEWAPTRRDQIRLVVVREVDDPDQLDANGYRLTGARISLRAAGADGITITAGASLDSAAFIGSALRETLAGATAGASWALDPALALTAAYVFNDRQANRLRAANEHIVTLGVTWTP